MIKIKKRKANTIMDIIIALMLISTVLYFCYSLATSSINKRQQINLEREAMTIAENIMNRVLSKGIHSIESEPLISNETLNEITNILNNDGLSIGEKNALVLEKGGRLPVNRDLDAPFLPTGDTYRNKYTYQVVVENYLEKTGTDASNNPIFAKHSGLKRITVNVYFPTKVVKYLDNNSVSSIKDTASLEEEYRVVTLTTYKASREY